MVPGIEAREMTELIANYCELSRPIMKREPLVHPTLGNDYHRTYPSDFKRMIMNSKEPKDVLTAYKALASSIGAHSDLPEEGWEKIRAAELALDHVQT